MDPQRRKLDSARTSPSEREGIAKRASVASQKRRLEPCANDISLKSRRKQGAHEANLPRTCRTRRTESRICAEMTAQKKRTVETEIKAGSSLTSALSRPAKLLQSSSLRSASEYTGRTDPTNVVAHNCLKQTPEKWASLPDAVIHSSAKRQKSAVQAAHAIIQPSRETASPALLPVQGEMEDLGDPWDFTGVVDVPILLHPHTSELEEQLLLGKHPPNPGAQHPAACRISKADLQKALSSATVTAPALQADLKLAKRVHAANIARNFVTACLS